MKSQISTFISIGITISNCLTSAFVYPLLIEYLINYDLIQNFTDQNLSIKLGLILLAYELSRILGGYLWIKLSFYLGSSLSLIISLIILSILNLCFSFTQGFYSVLLIRGLSGLFNNLNNLSKVYFSQFTTIPFLEKYSLFIVNLSTIIGFLVGGFLNISQENLKNFWGSSIGLNRFFPCCILISTINIICFSLLMCFGKISLNFKRKISQIQTNDDFSPKNKINAKISTKAVQFFGSKVLNKESFKASSPQKAALFKDEGNDSNRSKKSLEEIKEGNMKNDHFETVSDNNIDASEKIEKKDESKKDYFRSNNIVAQTKINTSNHVFKSASKKNSQLKIQADKGANNVLNKGISSFQITNDLQIQKKSSSDGIKSPFDNFNENMEKITFELCLINSFLQISDIIIYNAFLCCLFGSRYFQLDFKTIALVLSTNQLVCSIFLPFSSYILTNKIATSSSKLFTFMMISVLLTSFFTLICPIFFKINENKILNLIISCLIFGIRNLCILFSLTCYNHVISMVKNNQVKLKLNNFHLYVSNPLKYLAGFLVFYLIFYILELSDILIYLMSGLSALFAILTLIFLRKIKNVNELELIET